MKKFARMKKVDRDKLEFDSRPGQKFRRTLLVMLKDLGGLKCRKFARLDEFAGVTMNSLGSMYCHKRKGKK